MPRNSPALLELSEQPTLLRSTMTVLLAPQVMPALKELVLLEAVKTSLCQSSVSLGISARPALCTLVKLLVMAVNTTNLGERASSLTALTVLLALTAPWDLTVPTSALTVTTVH